MYNTVDMITDKVDLEEISYLEDVINLFELNPGVENYLVATDGSTNELRLSEKAAEDLEEAAEYSEDIGNSGKFGGIIGGETGTVYYLKDVDDDYGKLYSYVNGKSNRLLQDVVQYR